MNEGWTLLESETVLDTPWMRVARNSYRVGSNVLSDYYLITRADFVLVHATDENDRVVLVRQYRPGTERSHLGLPAGYIDTAETPDAAARRELNEETGLTGSNLEQVGQLHALPGYLRSTAYVFTCNVSAAEFASARTQDAEEISGVLRVGRSEAVAMVLSGEISEMQAASALLLVEAMRHRMESGGPSQ